MYTLNLVTPRVERLREQYRSTKPEICTARYRLITEFYLQNPQLTGILKRAKNFKNICEHIPVRIGPEEVIVGAQSGKYRACALYPENSMKWLKEEVEDRSISTRDIDPYILSEEDRTYILDTADFWMKECMSAKADAYIPDGYFPHSINGITMFGPSGNTVTPVGHFCTNYEKAIKVGFRAIKDEADHKLKQLEEEGIYASSIEQYNFYRAISIVCDGMMLLSRRYAALAAEMAAAEGNALRRQELLEMADTLNWVMEKPCRSFHDALQCLCLYQTCLCLDANMHGISFGRVDQYLGDFYNTDISTGLLTAERGQELLDLFYLKIAEMNKPWSYAATMTNPGYTCGMLMTLGGVKKDGTDATNAVTYMMLQTVGRLILHDPPQAMRVHKGTPTELWEAAIETTKISGGVPTFESDEVIIPALMERGLSLESARNYCLIGCVEPAGCGDEWPACGGTGTESYWNFANALILAINNGVNPMEGFQTQAGLPTGYLYEMETFDDVLEAVKKQMEFFLRWHMNMVNSFEYVAREVLPLPVVSATMEGCMDSGRDVMYGGAKYNSTGLSGIAIGNIADSLGMIKYMIYDKRLCTARQLYDAIMADWVGYENLQQTILHQAPHYGNDNEYTDQFAAWVSDLFSKYVKNGSGPRGNHFSPGLYPVTTNVVFGYMTCATPDGRKAGTPLADGISPVQQMDKNGPTAVLKSVAHIKQSLFSNGTLLNMKFHPSSMKNEDSKAKLRALMESYFAMGGMELQINIVSSETLRDAQKHPENYRNLVVRVAGFSAYFVELHIDGQNDLIRRTELNV